MRNRIYLATATAGLLGLVTSSAAQDSGITARDIFYSAADLLGKTPPGPRLGGIRKKRPGPESTVTSTVLGLRYSILKRNFVKQYAEVPPETIFYAGDKIRLSVMSNEKGYLYIVQQGSSGTWSPLFPNPEINGGMNLIEAGERYEIPGGRGEDFVLDERAGEERIFMMLTRQAEPDLDKIVMALREGGVRDGRITARISPTINNALIEQLREQVESRDLVFTKVDDADNEKAVYVVNAGASSKPNSRVVVDLKLNHR